MGAALAGSTKTPSCVASQYCSRRLKTEHGGKRARFSRVAVLAITGPVCGNVSGVAERKEMEFGRVAEFVNDFESGCFLSGDSIRIDRVHDREIVALPKFAHDPERVIEVAIDGDDFGAVSESLNQFAAGDFPRGQDDHATDSRARRIRRRGCGGIAGGRADQRDRSALNGFRDGHSHAAVLERAGGIESFVFQVNFAAASDDGAEAR